MGRNSELLNSQQKYRFWCNHCSFNTEAKTVEEASTILETHGRGVRSLHIVQFEIIEENRAM